MTIVFDDEGLLPPGDHRMTMTELRTSMLVQGGPLRASSWDTVWRATLVDSFCVLCGHLFAVGIYEIYADGSFATDKPHPGDIDGYFVCDFQRFLTDQLPRLVRLDPSWDISVRRPDASGKLKPLMWHNHRVELFPHYNPPFDGCTVAGITSSGKRVGFPDFFRYTRSGQPRGIVRILAEE